MISIFSHSAHSGTGYTVAVSYTAHAYTQAHTHAAQITAEAPARQYIPTRLACSRQDLGRGITVGLFGTNALINGIAAAVYFSFGQASCLRPVPLISTAGVWKIAGNAPKVAGPYVEFSSAFLGIGSLLNFE